MRADRLLSALLQLQAHGRMTGRELAKRLEVSERTVHRDMEALSAAGVPVYALRGSHGGWQLDEDWRTQVPGLDGNELRALLMAQPRVIGDAPLAAAADRAMGKLMAALPTSLRAEAASIRQRLYIDPTGWRGSNENFSMLPAVQDAVSRDRKLAIKYWRAGEESVERAVDPLGLVAKGSAWYLVASSENGLRTYRVSRIESARVLEEPCERPQGFDLAEYWRLSTERFQEAWPRYHATLCLEPRAASWMRHWRSASAVPQANADPEGWVTLRFQFDNEEQACVAALGLGPRARVIEPESLKVRVAANAGLFPATQSDDPDTFRLPAFGDVIRTAEAQHRTIEEQRASERLAAQEIEIARQVQARLFPQTLPACRTLDYAGVCIQARQVGGDYYDFLNLGKDRLGLVIGDISGKGIAAALLMANLQANMRGQSAAALDQPHRFLQSVNRLFFDNTSDSSYATLFFAEYDGVTQCLRYVNCGHLPALLLRANGDLEQLNSTSTVLGLFQNWECVTGHRKINSGDTLLLYTDGVTEAFSGSGEEFGEQRLADALRKHGERSSQEMLNAIAEDVRSFSSGEQRDDVTLIAAKCCAA